MTSIFTNSAVVFIVWYFNISFDTKVIQPYLYTILLFNNPRRVVKMLQTKVAKWLNYNMDVCHDRMSYHITTAYPKLINVGVKIRFMF